MSTASSHGAASRRPVFSGNRRVPGLYARTLASGATVYEVALRLGGNVRRHTLIAKTKTDAIVELRALQTDYVRGEQHRSPAAAVTVAELAADYLTHLETRVGSRDPRRRRSGRTVALYRQRLDDHILRELGQRPAAELSVVDVRRLIDVLGRKRLSPSTITGTVNVLSGLLRFGVKTGALERNVVRDLDPDDRPGVTRVSEPRYLEAAELARLLAALSDTFRPLAAVCAFAGLRISEALGLRWRDIDLKARTLTVSAQLAADGSLVPVKSTASAAAVPIVPMLFDELQAHRHRQAGRSLRRVHRDALVFVTARGKPQSRRNALRAIHAAGDATGLNDGGRERIGVHDLRHSFVAIALAAGFTLPEAAALARHANPRVTATVYAGLTDTARAELGTKLAAAFAG
ncbi:MAG TPA: site-specific integrase [Gaiellaceae bacterium]|nr:site-specific integrase [Gaiellaceae bacterium]